MRFAFLNAGLIPVVIFGSILARTSGSAISHNDIAEADTENDSILAGTSAAIHPNDTAKTDTDKGSLLTGTNEPAFHRNDIVETDSEKDSENKTEIETKWGFVPVQHLQQQQLQQHLQNQHLQQQLQQQHLQQQQQQQRSQRYKCDTTLSEGQKRAFSQFGQTRNGVALERYHWPKGVVYYRIDSGFTTRERSVILSAMSHIAKRTCIRFEPKTETTVDFVTITPKQDGCFAEVGRVGGQQLLNLSPRSGCVHRSVAIHELIHAIGFWHEQNRSDRDDFVQINWANIDPTYHTQFAKLPADIVDPFGVGYDYKSVMHYGGYDFAMNPTVPTIIPGVAGLQPADLGNQQGMTDSDAEKINNMYASICNFED